MTGLVTTIQLLRLFRILYDEVSMSIFSLYLQISDIFVKKAIVQYVTFKSVTICLWNV